MKVFVRPTGAPLGVGATLGFAPNGSSASLDTAPTETALATGDLVLMQRNGALVKIDASAVGGGGGSVANIVAGANIAVSISEGTVTISAAPIAAMTLVGNPTGASGVAGAISLSTGLGFVNGALANTGVVAFQGRLGSVTLSSADVTGALGFTPVNPAILGQPSGVATLGSDGRLTSAQVPAGIVSGLHVKGIWNAATNSPTLGNGGAGGVSGDVWLVGVAGTTSLDGTSTWGVSDAVVNNGSAWGRVPWSTLLGSLAIQNANNVAITGGSATGLAQLGALGGFTISQLPSQVRGWSVVFVGSDGQSQFGGIDETGQLVLNNAAIANLTATNATITDLTATTATIGSCTMSELSPLTGIQVGFAGPNGELWLSYGLDGVVAVSALRVGGTLISPQGGASPGVPSYAVDITQYGGVRDGHGDWFYASWGAAGTTVTISWFNGAVTVTQGSTALAIAGVLGSGIAFWPGIHDGQPIYLQGCGTGGTDLVTTVAEVTDGQNVVLADPVETVPSGPINVVCPCFMPSDGGKVVWLSGAEVKNFWVDTGPTLTQDMSQTYGVQPLMATIASVLGPTEISIALSAGSGITGFPLAVSGAPTHIKWFSDNANARGAAADGAQQIGSKFVYHPGTKGFFGSASLMHQGNVYRAWFGANTSRAALYSTVALCDAWRGGFDVDIGGRRLWTKQIPASAGAAPGPLRTLNLRKQCPGLAGKTSLKIAIMGSSLGQTDPAKMSPIWMESDLFQEQFAWANPGVAVTWMNISLGGTNIGLLDNNRVFASDASKYPWYTNTSETWFNYLLTMSPPPDIVFMPIGGADDGLGFHPIHFWSVVNRIRAALPSCYIVWATMNTHGTGLYNSESDDAEQNAYCTGYIAGACNQANIPFLHYTPPSERANFGWDQTRRRERTIPSWTGPVSATVPWSFSDTARDFSGIWTLQGANGAAAWGALGKLTFRLSPREDNVLTIDIDPSNNLRCAVQDWGGSTLTPCALSNGGNVLTTSGQASFTGAIRWDGGRRYLKAGDPGPGPFTSGNLGNCVMFPGADQVGLNQRTFITHVANSFVVWTPDCPGGNGENILNPGTLVYGGMMFVPADATAQSDCVITDASGNTLVTKITGYTNQNTVQLRDAWPYPALTPGTPATVWVGRFSVPPTSSAVPAGTDTGVGPQLQVAVKGNTIIVRYWLGGTIYAEPPVILRAIIPRLSGEFVPLIWATGSGTLAGANLFVDEDDFSMPQGMYLEMRGSPDANGDYLFAGEGGHPGSVNAEMLRTILNVQEFGF